MMLLHSLSLAALLGASSVAAVAAAQPLPQGTPEGVCGQGDSASEQGLQDGHVVLGVVSSVDRRTGLLTLETNAGRIEMAASAEDLNGLQEGDILVVCLMEEGPFEDDILKGPFIA